MMRSSLSFMFLMLLLILISCGNTPETGLTETEEKLFIDTYVNLVLATWDQQVGEDSLNVLRQGVFDEMGISEEQFMDLSRQAEAAPERWVEVWDQIVERLEAETEKDQDQKSDPAAS
jgi:hypothetical protein